MAEKRKDIIEKIIEKNGDDAMSRDFLETLSLTELENLLEMEE